MANVYLVCDGTKKAVFTSAYRAAIYMKNRYCYYSIEADNLYLNTSNCCAGIVTGWIRRNPVLNLYSGGHCKLICYTITLNKLA